MHSCSLQRVPAALQSSLYARSLICCTESGPCRRHLPIGSIVVVLRSRFGSMRSSRLRHGPWGGSCSPKGGRGGGGELRASCCSRRRRRWEAKGSGQRSCEHTSVILQVCRSPKQSSVTPRKWRGTKGNNGARRFFPPGGCSLPPGRLPRLPRLPRHPFVASFTCLWSEAVHSARGCLAGATASSIRVYLILLVGG